MKKLIVFNWKMMPASKKEAVELFGKYLKLSKVNEINKLKADFVVCPPFVYLNDLKTKKLKNLKIGAQDVFWKNPPAGGGAYTGEISPKMLKDLGVEYVIIGHSERRQYLNETDEVINKKIKAALSTGLKVILCVGEDLKIRKKGKKAVENFIKKQLIEDLKNSKFLIHNSKLRNRFVIAYEPIWAIGTGIPCKPKDAQETIKFIKSFINSYLSLVMPVLYGGSVNSQNIKSFIQLDEIGGALVGGASLKKEEIKKIIEIFSK